MRRAFFFVNSIALPKPSTTFTMFLQSLFISNLLLLLMREEWKEAHTAPSVVTISMTSQKPLVLSPVTDGLAQKWVKFDLCYA